MFFPGLQNSADGLCTVCSTELCANFKFFFRNQKEIKSRQKSQNACYHLVQNLLSSSLLSKNLQMKYTEL
jgi:hypothetical protein